MSRRPAADRFVIERGGRGMTYRHADGFTVYQLGTYPRGSVLAGQQSRRFVNRFDTLEAARAAHPTAQLLAGTSYQTPDLSHLPDDEDGGDW